MNEQKPAVAVTAADISEYLASADDFAFEREVFHVANGLGFDARHSGLYVDPVTNKPREFDVRASFTSGANRISMAIECKALKQEFPLVVSGVPRPADEAWHEVLHADAVQGRRGSFTRITRFPSDPYTGIYRLREGVGKSMRQVRRETRGPREGQIVTGDEVFDKWTQSLASLAELVDAGADQLSVGAAQHLAQIAFLPVLVISDGTLWIADYSSRGDLQRDPFQVESVDYFLGRQYPLEREGLTLTITHLHITTRTTVRTLLDSIARGGGIWQQLFPQ